MAAIAAVSNPGGCPDSPPGPRRSCTAAPGRWCRPGTRRRRRPATSSWCAGPSGRRPARRPRPLAIRGRSPRQRMSVTRPSVASRYSATAAMPGQVAFLSRPCGGRRSSGRGCARPARGRRTAARPRPRWGCQPVLALVVVGAPGRRQRAARVGGRHHQQGRGDHGGGPHQGRGQGDPVRRRAGRRGEGRRPAGPRAGGAREVSSWASARTAARTAVRVASGAGTAEVRAAAPSAGGPSAPGRRSRRSRPGGRGRAGARRFQLAQAEGGQPDRLLTGHLPAPFQALAAAAPRGGAGPGAAGTGWCRGAPPSRWPPRRRSGR